uniref:Flavin reductase family protein n=1 Tax=Janibacter limosus TaxID=53458 RepID=A0AC61U2D6_9MICO|nr:flavin reductase family protein [Janibacter limosus]
MRTVFDVSDPDTNAYALLTSVVVPRPIAWITSIGSDGVGNLAPHSFFNVACARPPIVSFTSVGRKDTLRNVLQTQHFVINLVSEELADLANASSAPFDPWVDEADTLGVTLEPSELVPVPRVADSPVSIECRLHSSIKLGNSHLVLGDVPAITVRDDALVDGHPSMAALLPDVPARPRRVGAPTRGGPPDSTRASLISCAAGSCRTSTACARRRPWP